MSTDINISAVLEALNNKVDLDLKNSTSNNDWVIETYTDDTTWYRKYKSGWIEQGGLFVLNASWTTTVVTLPVEMANNLYTCITMTGNTGYTNSPCVSDKTSTSFKCYPYNNNYPAGGWFVCGQSKIGA